MSSLAVALSHVVARLPVMSYTRRRAHVMRDILFSCDYVRHVPQTARQITLRSERKPLAAILSALAAPHARDDFAVEVSFR